MSRGTERPDVEPTDRYEPMPSTNGGCDFALVTLDRFNKPTCIRHGAMNKVSPSPPGFWRCLHISGCRAGAQEHHGG